MNRIGDIIRLQKVKCKEFRGQKQFNVNVYANKSEWAMFRGNVTDREIFDEVNGKKETHFHEHHNLNKLDQNPDFWLLKNDAEEDSENRNPNQAKTDKTNGPPKNC